MPHVFSNKWHFCTCRHKLAASFCVKMTYQDFSSGHKYLDLQYMTVHTLVLKMFVFSVLRDLFLHVSSSFLMCDLKTSVLSEKLLRRPVQAYVVYTYLLLQCTPIHNKYVETFLLQVSEGDCSVQCLFVLMSLYFDKSV